MFGKELKDSIVYFHCDNQAVVHIVNKFTSKDRVIMFFVRKLLLLTLKYNIDIRAYHVPGADNLLCDALSRFQATPLLLRHYNMKLAPESIPQEIMPSDSLIMQAEISAQH